MFQNPINKSLSISKIFFLLKWNYQALIQNHLILLENCDPMGYTVHGILQARILEWVAFPFYRGFSQFRDWTQVSLIAGGFFTSWATREALPASGSFPMRRFFTSGGQSIEASASALVLPMNIQGWFPLGLPGLISLQSKGLSRVFSSTTIWKHQFFGAQPSWWSNSHIRTRLLEKP